ncbi:MAG: hypothetical protein IJ715_01225 [Bacilli bacterium]|nr:hypothetical protein [Bacilli bacterium]
MNNDVYLIPANSKKSMMIFGMFYPFDLILFGTGLSVTLLLLMILPLDSLIVSLIAISPGLITGLLVFPLPNYHNTLTVLIDVIDYFTTRQKFVWKGWCVMDELKKNKE